MHYSYEKDSERHLIRGPVKKLIQFGAIDTTVNNITRDSEKFNYYTASFTARRFDKGGSGIFKYDTLGLLTWRQRLKTSIHERFSDTIKADRMNISYYEYDNSDVKDKLRYKQKKKTSWFVHNPYRVKIKPNSYQAYSMKVDKDSTYREINYRYKYKKNELNYIDREEYYVLFDNNLDGTYDHKEQRYYADYIYNGSNQLIRKEYTITDRIKSGTINIDDFEFDDIPKQFSPVIHYEWDERGNLLRVITVPDKGRPTYNHMEEYYYDDNDQLIKMRREHPRTILRSYNKHVRDIYDLYFDNKGNVVKVESIDDDRKTVHATYLFEYDKYDEYSNWTVSYGYLDGDKTKKPNIVTKRIIEYY